MSYQKAAFEDKNAPLHSDFANEFVLRRLGPVVHQAVYEFMPKYVRGPKTGLVKGHVQWMKVAVGGWTVNLPMSPSRGVVKPGTQWVRVTLEWDRQAPHVWGPGCVYSDMKDDEIRARIQLAITNIVNNPRREKRYG